VVAPIPVEEYISIKFKDIEAKLGVIRQELTSKFEEVNSVVDKFKADTTDKLVQLEADMDYVKTETQDLSLSLVQIKARLNSAEGDLGVLAEEMVALNVQNDNIVKHYNDLEVRIKNLEQEVQDIDYLSPKEKAGSWY
jgi:chromosome segregation ATPase